MNRNLLSVAIFALLLNFASFAVSGDSSHQWEVQGVMSDACQCTVFCPCEFMSTPSFGHCDDAAILHIEKGHYGNVNLDGMRVSVVSQSPKGKRLVDTVGHLNFAHIYVPEKVTDAQMNALADIARRVFGSFVTKAAQISPNETVQRVKMDVTIQPNRHRILIPDVLDLDLEAVIGGDEKTPVILKNNAFTAAGFGDIIVAQSKVYKYKAKEIDWDYGGRSASIRTFKMGGELGDSQ